MKQKANIREVRSRFLSLQGNARETARKVDRLKRSQCIRLRSHISNLHQKVAFLWSYTLSGKGQKQETLVSL